MDLSGFNKFRDALHSKDYKKYPPVQSRSVVWNFFVSVLYVMWSTAAKFFFGFQ